MCNNILYNNSIIENIGDLIDVLKILPVLEEDYSRGEITTTTCLCAVDIERTLDGVYLYVQEEQGDFVVIGKHNQKMQKP